MAHLTREQRYTISAMYKEKYSQSDIAKTIGKGKSVVSRELKGEWGSELYLHCRHKLKHRAGPVGPHRVY